MPRWSGRDAARAQVEPLVALAAVFAVGVAVSAYALALTAATPAAGDRDRADPALRRVTDRVANGSVVDPANLRAGLAAAPDGYQVRITLVGADHTWTVGPGAPPGASAAARPVSVRLDGGRIRPARLRVEVWA